MRWEVSAVVALVVAVTALALALHQHEGDGRQIAADMADAGDRIIAAQRASEAALRISEAKGDVATTADELAAVAVEEFIARHDKQKSRAK